MRVNSPAACPSASPFRARADGTRRRILESLRERERSVNELVEGLDASSQPALSQHLKVLREAGLVTVRRNGRRQMYALDPSPLTEVCDWLAHFDRFWDGKLDAPKVGHAFTMQTKPGPGFDGVVRCEVLELDAPRVMVWRWQGGGIDTTVRFECSPEREGTRLTLTHDGFRGVGPRLVGMILSRGWAKMLSGALAKEIASEGR